MNFIDKENMLLSKLFEGFKKAILFVWETIR